MKACLFNLKDNTQLVPFSNGRREGANPSSRVIVPLDLEFLDQYCKPVNLA